MIGSAASLSSIMPQAPLSPFARPRIGLVHALPDEAAPRRMAPVPKAADDLPGGHVLLVEDDAAAALEVQQMLRDSGYRVVGPATSGEEAQRLVDRARRPFLCALLDACIPGAAGIADSLAVHEIPVVWIASAASDAFAWDRREEPVVRQPFDRDDLLDAIERSVKRANGHRLYPVPPPQQVWPRVFPQL
ncbi:MAG: response regulator [Enhydrobacter sp.]|nr:response regulator [Enhydrobacter sp.]